MANALYLKGKAVAEVTSELTGYEFAIVLADSGVEVNATYSMDMDSGDPIMAGMTQYGRLTALVDSTDSAKDLTITAIPLGDDGTHAVEVTVSIDDIAEMDIGDSLSGLS